MIKRIYFIFTLCSLSLMVFAQYPAPQVRYTSFVPNTNNIEIRWDASTAPGVSYYEVRYYYPPRPPLDDGWVKINGNINAAGDLSLTFDASTLTQANPLAEPVIVGVQAFDASGASLNTLETYTFDSTVYLTADYDSCQASVNLNWNHYRFKQWPQPGSVEYQVFISQDNGATFNYFTSVSNTQNNLQITDLETDRDYVLYVSAISENNPGEVANSNTVQVNTTMARLPEYMYANFASYGNKSAINLSFSIDPLSETSIYNILRSASVDGPYEQIEQVTTDEKEISYSDNIAFVNGPYYYKLEVVNYCGVNIRESENTASTLLLQRNGEAVQPELSWNSYQNWLGGVSHYSIERRFSNEVFTEITSLSDTIYTDSELETLVENNYPAKVCYRITGIESGGINTSTSNTICYELPVNIRFEYDAFTPGSGAGNETFGPTIDFIPDEYLFRILDRNGRKVYESRNAEDTRWDGKINGTLAPVGAYMCLLQYRVGGGKKHTIQAAVVVVQ
jgi:hypothetical protein